MEQILEDGNINQEEGHLQQAVILQVIMTVLVT
jgi:hypothetical protein